MATIEIESRLIALDTIAFFLHSPLEVDSSYVSNENYSITVRSRLQISELEKTISVIMAIDLKAKTDMKPDSEEGRNASSTDKFPSMHYEGIATFKIIKGIKLELDKKTNTVDIPTGFVRNIGDITYSTLRGIIFGKCEGSLLKNVMIPILGPEQINNIMRQSMKEAAAVW